MEVNDQTLSVLQELLINTLSPNNEIRKSAESYIQISEQQVNFPLLILTLINKLSNNNNTQDIAIKQTASVLFKNIIKKRWVNNENDDSNTTVIVITENEKVVIKNLLIDLMCTVSTDVQKQLAEAVTIIAKYDFPNQWNGLLLQLMQKLDTKDIHIAKGVMITANSIMKRFRYVFKSDELYSQLVICLKEFQKPLLDYYQYNSELIQKFSNQKNELEILYETQRLMTRIFFSLNWQDLPEFFEDNMNLWMTNFAQFLTYTNPLLIDNSEEVQPGPIEKLQAAIIDNLNLYATKYEEELQPYLAQFTQLIWKLLMEVGASVKYDLLATSAIKFLTTVASKQMNTGLFSDSVISDIIQHIVIKNLTATEGDEEIFEDNPTDYTRKDMEASDQDTRRRCAIELVRGLLKYFGPTTSQICLNYINAMLESYNTSKDWRAKDAALHLVLAVSVISGSTTTGAGELNTNVNILSIFESHVLPEIHDNVVDARPIVKADAIKLVCIFRSHFQGPFLLALMPHIIRHLQSKYVVVQTYAALCIERFLALKDRDSCNNMIPRITKENMSPLFQSLFSGLFTALDNPEMPDNDYVMKCIMRMLVLAGTDVTPVTELVLNHLTKALERVCKNPVNPHFNHYLFESVSLLVRNVCQSNGSPEATLTTCTRFESLLFPPFQAVLAQDVVEFIPYVFQILALLLSSRPNAGLSDAYKSLFPPLLSPAIWERKGNVPALTDLFKAYISKGINEIVSGNHLTAVLGVFQKLLASRATEVHAFDILNALYCFTDKQIIASFLPTILNLLLKRMQESTKNPGAASKLAKLFLYNLALYCISYEAKTLYDALETLTPGLPGMVVTGILSVNCKQFDSSDKLELKHMIIGYTQLLVETPLIQNEAAWTTLFISIAYLITISKNGSVTGSTISEDFLEDEEMAAREFDSAYSKLAYANVAIKDITEATIPSATNYFALVLGQFCSQHPNQYSSIIQRCLPENEATVIRSILAENNVSLG